MKVTALAPWFGSNRMLADWVGAALKGCEWVGVPFAGGMCELAHINARTMHVNDLHRGIINLARVVRDQREELQAKLDATAVHPDELRASQDRCRHRERDDCPPMNVSWAVDYFICAWMARSATAGTKGELNGGLAVRWNAAGGDSAVRFRSAIDALTEWQRIMKRCTFDTLDVFEFLKKCKDAPGHGIYCDPPFPGPGGGYKHQFTEEQHRQLAGRLASFAHCRVVCRFYDHPLIRELYPEDQWAWNFLKGRKQTNDEAPEVLLVRNGP